MLQYAMAIQNMLYEVTIIKYLKYVWHLNQYQLWVICATTDFFHNIQRCL